MKTEWISVEFIKKLQIGWNWDDFMQDATAAERNIHLAVAGLVLSRNAEVARQPVETTSLFHQPA